MNTNIGLFVYVMLASCAGFKDGIVAAFFTNSVSVKESAFFIR